MRWIGLTGGIACGKSTVSHALRQHGFVVVDADEVAKSVVLPGTPGLKSVLEKFGNGFLDSEGNLDRRKLGQHVFPDPSRRRELETLLHPLIRQEVRRRREQLEAAHTAMAIYDIPLLMETKSQDQFDEIIVVTCAPEQQRQRLRLRHQWTEEEIEMRIRSQMPLSYKEELADFVVHNDKTEAHLTAEIDRLVRWLKQLA